jgi:predicted outer membrane protein
MKQLTMFVAVTLAGTVLLTGCGQQEQAPPSAPPTPPAAMTKPTTPPAPVASKPVSTSAMEMAASVKGGIDKAMALAKEGKYQDALGLLQGQLAQVQNNPEAKKLVDDAIAQVKQMMTAAATKQAEGAATKAVGDLMKK